MFDGPGNPVNCKQNSVGITLFAEIISIFHALIDVAYKRNVIHITWPEPFCSACAAGKSGMDHFFSIISMQKEQKL